MPEHFQPYTIEQRVPDALRAPEANELLGRTPGWLTRWGTISLILITGILMSVGFMVKYPDTLEGHAFITTDPLPIRLKAQTSGRLARLLAADGTLLQSGTPIAEIENPTGYANIQMLESMTDNLRSALLHGNDSLPEALIITPVQTLGDAQAVYNQLIQQLSARSLLHKEALYEKRNRNLQTQIGNLGKISQISKEEHRMAEQQLKQAAERFKANEQLYREKVISRQEYFEEAARLRTARMQLEQQKRSNIQNAVSANEHNKQLLELEYEHSDKERAISLGIEEALRNLTNYIQNWKHQFLLVAPFAGTIHFIKPLQENQSVTTGEELMVVLPKDNHFTAVVMLAASGIGKVVAGQKVHLLLDNYPYNEYGFLEGTVQKRSTLPEPQQSGGNGQQASGATYRVIVQLPAILKTSYHKTIPFNPEMTATGRIITRDRSLIQRLLAGVAKMEK